MIAWNLRREFLLPLVLRGLFFLSITRMEVFCVRDRPPPSVSALPCRSPNLKSAAGRDAFSKVEGVIDRLERQTLPVRVIRFLYCRRCSYSSVNSFSISLPILIDPISKNFNFFYLKEKLHFEILNKPHSHPETNDSPTPLRSSHSRRILWASAWHTSPSPS